MAYIHHISTANPHTPIAQNEIANFMCSAMRLNDEQERKLRAVFRISGIQSRHSVIKDYAHGEPKHWKFYPHSNEHKEIKTAERMSLFQNEALPLADLALNKMSVKQNIQECTHLITVSCTGMFAPGLDIQLIKKWGLNSSVERTSIQFMGCFAALNALKSARHICHSDPNAKVLIVCVELCTIHFQSEFNEDNLLANTLFADGAACVWVSNKPDNSLYEIAAFESVVDDNSEDEMAWKIGNTGFEMKLSSYVPQIIERKIAELSTVLMGRLKLKLSAIHHYAIHPGGKRILQAVEKGLGLSANVNDVAYDILKRFGNMSSPTILFVLEEMASKVKRGENVLSFAFGPGLTMESMLLKGNGQS